MQANSQLLEKAQSGFSTLNVSENVKKSALEFLELWLTDKDFAEYLPQIDYLINEGKWEILLDSFYQIIPFGTGGRRGLVGIGPNRINVWAIQTSAQGHSQYLIKKYGQEAKDRGIVLTFDVRQYLQKGIYSDQLPNPVAGLSCQYLAEKAAEVYAANGIKTFLFDGPRSTPELSFAIRYLKAIGGDMFSASHNPPTDNGKKVYDLTGGQLIPPFDQELLDEVTKNVSDAQKMDFEKAQSQGLVKIIGNKIDNAYIQAVSQLSLSPSRKAKIVYSPFHGTGLTSVYEVLKRLNFLVELDPKTSNPSGKFENITFNIPNPEVPQSFTNPLDYAIETNADILLGTDPDADRIGIMVNTGSNQWQYLNGNEIGAVLTEYIISKNKEKGTLSAGKKVVKTMVTTSLIEKISLENGIRCLGDLLVGYKYIGDEMNKMEAKGEIDDFLFSAEESHGYIAGNYARDKDAAIAAVYLSELASELREKEENLIGYLNKIYSKYGYFRNYLTEIRLLGAAGQEKIEEIQHSLRQNPPKYFGDFWVESSEDKEKGAPFLSQTDKLSRNVLVFHLAKKGFANQIKVTVRPSGTEPKIKMYYEIGTQPFTLEKIDQVKKEIETLLSEVEKAFMKHCYKVIGVDFPDRGFLLFNQIPLEDKLKYFEIEGEIIKLKNISDAAERKEKLSEMLKFLGSDPIEKVNAAFTAQYNEPLKQYLQIL